MILNICLIFILILTILVTYIYINQTEDVIISVNIDKNDEYNKNIVTSDINSKTPVTVDNILILNETLQISDLSYINLLYMKYNQTKAEPLPGTVLFSVKMDGGRLPKGVLGNRYGSTPLSTIIRNNIYPVEPGFMSLSEIPSITGNLFDFTLSKSIPYKYRIMVNNFGFTYYPDPFKFGNFSYMEQTLITNGIFPVYIDNISINNNNIKINVSTVSISNYSLQLIGYDLMNYPYGCVTYDTLKTNPYEVSFVENSNYDYSSFYSTISISFVSIS